MRDFKVFGFCRSFSRSLSILKGPVVALIAFSFFLSRGPGCETAPPARPENPRLAKLEKARQFWQSLLEEKGPHYRYHTLWEGSEAPLDIRRIITVRDAQVVKVVEKRQYRPTPQNNQTPSEEVVEYTGDKIDRRRFRTISGIFRLTRQQYLTLDPEEVHFGFMLGKDGLPYKYGVTGKDCLDDCFSGAIIEKIEWID